MSAEVVAVDHPLVQHKLGLLRDEVGKNDGVNLCEADLARLTPAELAAHPAVLGSLG